MNRKAALLAAASITAFAGPALAQDATSPPTTAEAIGATPSNADGVGPQGAGPEEVLVTARKREEREQDVPVAMSTLTAAAIQRYSVQSFSQISALTPSLVISDAPSTGGGLVYMRGIGSGATAPSVDQSVSINIDGVPIGQANILRLGQTDLGRIEVLKGPQSLFFGKNSPAGVISLTSADPTDQFQTRLETGYEFYAKNRYVQGMISGPISSTLKARIVAYGAEQDGWFRNEIPNGLPDVADPRIRNAPQQKEYRVRGTLLWEPSDAYTAKLKVNLANKHVYGSGPAALYQIVSCPGNVSHGIGRAPGEPSDCKADRYYSLGDIDPKDAALSPAFGDGVPFLTDHLFLASLAQDVHLSDAITLTSVTGYYKERGEFVDNFSEGGLANLNSAQTTTYDQVSEEARVTSSFKGPLNFMVGGFYSRTNIYAPVATLFGPPILPLFLITDDARYKHLTESYSAFGDITFDLTPELELTAGGRYTHDYKSQLGSKRFPSAFSGYQEVPLTFAINTISFDNFSPEITLSFKPSSDVSYYATYREGFQSGGFNQTAYNVIGSDNSFNPEKARGGEIGAKGRIFDHQLQFAADGYYYKYRGLQLSSYDSSSGTFKIQNAGRATLYGAELSMSFYPHAVDGLSLRGTVDYTRARYNSFPATCYPGQSVAQGCNMLPDANGVFQSQSLKDRPLVRAMDWSASAGATYEGKVSEEIGFTLSGDAVYTGPYYAMLEEDPDSLQKAFWKFNASIAVHGPNRGWELALIGTNLTNELNYTLVQGSPLTGFGQGTNGPSQKADLASVLGDPRAVMLRLTLTEGLFR